MYEVYLKSDIFHQSVCVSVSQLDRTYHSLGRGGASGLSSVNPTSRVKSCILGKMPQVTCLLRTKHSFYIPIDYYQWKKSDKTWLDIWFESHLPMLAQRVTLWVFLCWKRLLNVKGEQLTASFFTSTHRADWPPAHQRQEWVSAHQRCRCCRSTVHPRALWEREHHRTSKGLRGQYQHLEDRATL